MSKPIQKRATNKDTSKLASLEKQIGLLRRDNAALREKCEDLSAQNLSLSQHPVTTPEQLAEFTRLRNEHNEMKLQHNKISLWLREFKSAEIARGEHAGRDLADVIIGYMRGKA